MTAPTPVAPGAAAVSDVPAVAEGKAAAAGTTPRLLAIADPPYPPFGGAGALPDVLVEPAPRGFIGAKPPAWTRWVLDALSYDPTTDAVCDLFAGSGSVAAALAAGTQLTVDGMSA